MYILAGFVPESEALVVNFQCRSSSPNLQKIQLAFQANEIRLAQQNTSNLLDFIANVSYKGGVGRGNGDFGRGSGGFYGIRGGRSSF